MGYARQLTGHKILIVGNHDRQFLRLAPRRDHKVYVPTDEALSVFDAVQCGAALLDGEDRKLLLSHFPAMPPAGAFTLHGHIHLNMYNDWQKILCRCDNVLNCCVEANGFRPVTFDQLCYNNMEWRRRCRRG